MAMSQSDFLNIIIKVLVLSVKQREVLSDGGYYTISTIIHWKYHNIRKWCTAKSKLKTTGLGAPYGDQKIKFIQAFSWWDIDLTLGVKQIGLADFDATVMEYCIDEAKYY